MSLSETDGIVSHMIMIFELDGISVPEKRIKLKSENVSNFRKMLNLYKKMFTN